VPGEGFQLAHECFCFQVDREARDNRFLCDSDVSAERVHHRHVAPLARSQQRRFTSRVRIVLISTSFKESLGDLHYWQWSASTRTTGGKHTRYLDVAVQARQVQGTLAIDVEQI
jgi:hypothetical protein